MGALNVFANPSSGELEAVSLRSPLSGNVRQGTKSKGVLSTDKDIVSRLSVKQWCKSEVNQCYSINS